MVETKHKPVLQAKGESAAARRKHSLAFKRRLVEQTLVPGASVARIALDNGVNANLLFKWRRQHVRAARSAPSSLLPVILSEPRTGGEVSPSAPTAAARMTASGGFIEVELPAGRIRIKGAVDVPALRVVLQMLAPAA
jgi:transposase